MFRGSYPRPRIRVLPISAVLFAVLAVLFLVQAAVAVPWTTEVISPRTVTVPGGQVVRDEAAAGQVVVKLQPSTSLAALQALAARLNGFVLTAMPTINTYIVGLPKGMSVLEGVATWRAQPGIALVEPDRMEYPTLIPNDPMYQLQDHLPQIKAPVAWDKVTGNNKQILAVVDSGVQRSHPDLAAKIWVNPNPTMGDINGWNFIENNNNVDPQDDGNPSIPGQVGHGTHVAGLAAAIGNNGVGVAGVNWGMTIMPVRIFAGGGGSPMSVIIQGFQYAVDHGATIINLSLGGGFSDTWTDPITQAFTKGIVVVAAAGNSDWQFTDDPSTWFSPVCNDGPAPTDNHVLGVAAVDKSDVKADFSNYSSASRPFVDVAAPGVNVLSTFPLMPTLGMVNLYDYLSGTSMACPVAAGVASLVQAAFPSFSPSQVIAQVRATTDNIDAKNPAFAGQLGTGRVNAGAAVQPVVPGPPRSVMAVTTPNTEGGSITVTWGKSKDDGRGLNTVVSYEVFRASSATGTMTSLKVLPKGSTFYVDTPVPNDTPYWYQVTASDAFGNAGVSPVVGPAVGHDNLAPPPVTQLTAVDTPADNGGSITLDWSGYTIPPEQNDFLQYNIYRSTDSAFSDVTGVTDTTSPIVRIAVVTDINTQNLLDTSVTDGKKYWYAVTAVDLRNNENKSVTSVGPAVSSPNFSFSWPAGLSMIAIGADTPDPKMADIFGVTDPTTLDLSRFDPSTGTYHQFNTTGGSTDTFLLQAPGRAFWLNTRRAVSLAVAGQPVTGQPNPAGDFPIVLQAGWNMVGNPYTADINLTDPTTGGRLGQVVVGGTTLSLDASNDQGYTRNYFWRYDAFSSAYRLVSASMGSLGETKIRRGQGVFFRAFTGCSLILPRPSGAAVPKVTTAAVTKATPSLDAWTMRVVAQAAGLASNDNFLGVSPQAAKLNGVVPPPFPGPGVRAVFVDDSAAKPGSVTDFVTALGATHTWKLRVTSDLPNVRVNLTWPDLSTMPTSLKPRLTDTATGRSVYMRTSSGYSFDVVDSATPRELELTVDGGTASTLALSGVQAAAAAGGADISYTLSASATVTVDIMNVAGRPVRQVLAGRPSPAGVSHAIWDGRGGSGAPVPSGQYLVRVTAAGPDGQAVSAVRPLMLRR